MPPGITPPLILNYNASTVPILQLALVRPGAVASSRCSTSAQNFIRPALATVPGAAIPYPYGGKVRQIQIDLDPQALQAQGPVGAGRGQRASPRRTRSSRPAPPRSAASQYNVKLNNAAEHDRRAERPADQDGRTAPRSIMRDVAHVRDGSPPQSNVVHVDGARAVLMTDAEERRRPRRSTIVDRRQGRCCRKLQADAAADAARSCRSAISRCS